MLNAKLLEISRANERKRKQNKDIAIRADRLTYDAETAYDKVLAPD